MQEPLYDKKVSCLCCESSFTTKRIRQGAISISRKDSDFCTYYQGENPLFYEVNVCPKCSFAFTDSFMPLKQELLESIYNDYTLTLNKNGPVQLCGIRSEEDALRSFKLGLVCASLTQQNSMTIANICMRIAWINRYRQNHSEEQKFLAKAVELYKESYLSGSGNMQSISKHKLQYLIAEIYGRLGNYEETKTWFNILLSQRNIEPAINTLARNQWAEYKRVF